MLLDNINSGKDLRKLDPGVLKNLASEIRKEIINITSKNGGHLASSLGAVELTIALHYVFNTPEDRLIWDVGHQSYAHKIINGRRNCFDSLRCFGGVSGFPKVSESEYDTYNVGHSSTSLSLAIGEAVARDMEGKDHKVIAVIGDGALSGGLAYEALNQIGTLKKDLIIILNDNDHSISKNVGAMSEYLTKIITGNFYNRSIQRISRFLKKLPVFGLVINALFDQTKINLKSFFVPKKIFEDLGLRYFGPVDGHNLDNLVRHFQRIKDLGTEPKIIHVRTKKGYGFNLAEKDPEKFHGVSPFNVVTGEPLHAKKIDYSYVAGSTIYEIAKKDDKVIAVTAAMTSGTGLEFFSKEFPKRFFDVGIAEGHAVTFSSALAKNGMKPFFAVYSTFLQRGYDQLIHDVALMKLPVKFLVDRSGVVGEDGETHHGLFDISYFSGIPNFMVLSPSSGEELRDMIYFAADYNDGPIAIRYPRGKIPDVVTDYTISNIYSPRSKLLSEGNDVAIIAVGDMVRTALSVEKLLKERNIQASVIDLSCVKPLDVSSISSVIKRCNMAVTIENSYVLGGISEHIMAALPSELRSKMAHAFGFPDEFITHGKMSELYNLYSLTPEKISDKIESLKNGS